MNINQGSLDYPFPRGSFPVQMHGPSEKFPLFFVYIVWVGNIMTPETYTCKTWWLHPHHKKHQEVDERNAKLLQTLSEATDMLAKADEMQVTCFPGNGGGWLMSRTWLRRTFW